MSGLRLSSRNAKKTHANQSILQIFCSSWKEITYKPSKVIAAKYFSPNMYGNFFRWMFFPPCYNWKTFFESLSLLWGFFQPSCWNKNTFYVISIMLIWKSQNKWLCITVVKFSQITLFFDYASLVCHFVSVPNVSL